MGKWGIKVSGKDIEIDDLTALKSGFKEFLNINYKQLSYKDIICSEAFYIFRYDFGMEPMEVLSSEDGIERYRIKLMEHFKDKGRKNPKSDSYTYCRNIKLLKEYVTGDTVSLSTGKEKRKVDIRISRKNRNREDIPRPSGDEVIKYLRLWDNLESYRFQEEALDKLFFVTYPSNVLMEDVLVKVSTLNDFYSTNIFAAYKVAKHIIYLNIDERLNNGDITLVDDIAKIEMDNGNIKNFYSFATKYCSHHKPLDFPIYDSFVDTLLKYFRDTDNFYEFKNDDLKDYVRFKNILIEFRRYYGLEQFNLKEIDKYLWLLGKEKFPKNYGKVNKIKMK